MRLRTMKRCPHWIPVAAAALFLLGVLVHPVIAAESVDRKDMRAARTALRDGRLAEARDVYEKVLRLPATEEQHFEALYQTVLILLATDTDAEGDWLARTRLESLGEKIQSGDGASELEVRALVAQVDSIRSLEATVDQLENRLVAESAAAVKAGDAQRAAADEALAAQRALVRAERRERLLAEQKVEQLRAHLGAREEELQARLEELARCASEMRFVTDQLEGTQESELQMLQVVIRKNEDLAKARLALQRREKKLVDQAAELEAKEAEIRNREEAIREVTERVLGKESPNS